MEELVNELRVAYLLVDDGDRRTLQEAGLTPTQFNLLKAVRASQVDPSVSSLAGQLLCTRGNVTRLVARMVAAGMVQTLADDNDQRLVRVRLTSEGQERLVSAENLLVAADRRRFGRISPSDLERIRGELAQLIEVLQADLDARD